MTAFTRATLGAVTLVAFAGCGGGGSSSAPLEENVRPDFIKGDITSMTYDGIGNNLLTARVGRAGIQAGLCPTALTIVVSPSNGREVPIQLRDGAICNNYRALVDVAANGGYGTLYGPNVDANSTVTAGDGAIAGDEHIAHADDGTGTQHVTMMVQIPDTFSPANACIVTAASSGSRGIYGAIGTAGEWGLKRGCAVAYTDKGTGNGADYLAGVTGTLLHRGTLAPPGAGTVFSPNLSDTDLAAFNAAFPNRWAFKHAHSQQNPEKTWGRDTLRAVEFAFYMLNQKYGEPSGTTRLQSIRRDNTIVIASSVSNGAGAAIMAAEQDSTGLIDGVAVAEPQIQMNEPAGLTIRRGTTAIATHGKTLYDYFTYANLYQPCASLATAASGSNSAGIPGVTTPNATFAANRCEALAARGLVSGTTPTERGNDALAKLLAYGWEPETVPFQASHYSLATLSVAVTYANAYSKSSVKDNLCGYSFGAAPVGGVVPTPEPIPAGNIFSTGNGIPPTSGINILNNNSVGGVAVDAVSISPTTGKQDLNIDGALCLRGLQLQSPVVSHDPTLNGPGTVLHRSVEELKVTGNLRGKPAIIVHGRADTLIPVNHTSRPYFGLNKTVDSASKLSYIEVTNAQHFDAFIDNAAVPGYDSRLVPLHVYFIRAMDAMYDHLKNGRALPGSQVVRTTPRGGAAGSAPAITAANVPAIAATPAAGDAIGFANNTVTIPD